MSQAIRQELRDRLAHAVVEAEAVLWGRVREMFPEAGQHGPLHGLSDELEAQVWGLLYSLIKAWTIENVPGMVEALATAKLDREMPDEPMVNEKPPPLEPFERDERDQT